MLTWLLTFNPIIFFNNPIILIQTRATNPNSDSVLTFNLFISAKPTDLTYDLAPDPFDFAQGSFPCNPKGH